MPEWFPGTPPELFPGSPDAGTPGGTSFHEVRFPLDYAQGASGGPMYSTKVTVVDSGAEQRVQLWSRGRLAFDIGYTANPTDFAVILAFFRARKGRAYGFRFRDWSDYTATLELITTAPVMQLTKTYADADGGEVRIITKPCSDGTFQLYDNGSPVGSSVDYTAGLVTPTSYSPGHTYRWSGRFDVPVRFDVDKLTFVQDHVGSRTIQALPVVEVLT